MVNMVAAFRLVMGVFGVEKRLLYTPRSKIDSGILECEGGRFSWRRRTGSSNVVVILVDILVVKYSAHVFVFPSLPVTETYQWT